MSARDEPSDPGLENNPPETLTIRRTFTSVPHARAEVGRDPMATKALADAVARLIWEWNRAGRPTRDAEDGSGPAR